MILISHRGNTNGKIPEKENHPDYIKKAINEGYMVEIDVWYIDNQLFLGHDSPQYMVNYGWFLDNMFHFWIHCKNKEAMVYFNTHEYSGQFNYFWHQNDDITLTSRKFMWVFPDKQPVKDSIAVLPELHDSDTSKCIGICSDFIDKYK